MFENETVRTIRLYGEVGRLFGRTHRFVATSMRDVMRALGGQIPGFEAYMAEAAARRQGFACLVGKRSLTEGELKGDFPADGDIRIAPVIQGNKRGGLFNIVLGAALVAVAAFATGGVGAAFAASGWAGTAAWMGASMVLSGVVQAIAPTAAGISTSDSPDNGTSYNFNGPTNTEAQGNPVPIVYSDADGYAWCGSAVVSQGIYSEDKV